jgi:hypothetical protein
MPGLEVHLIKLDHASGVGQRFAIWCRLGIWLDKGRGVWATLRPAWHRTARKSST